MNVLAFETATDACSTAVLTATAVHERHVLTRRRHTDAIFDQLTATLDDAGIALDDIACIAFGSGPGSFTGVRIAASIAQGIALARGLRVVAVSTLLALAAGAWRVHGASRIAVALDARRDEVYAAAYDFSAGLGEVRTLHAEAVLPPASLNLPDAGPWLTAGNGWSAYAGRFRGHAGALAAAAFAHPHAADVARIAALRAAAGETVAAHAAQPRYLRGALD